MKQLFIATLFIVTIFSACTPPKQESADQNQTIVFDTLDQRPLQIYLPKNHSEENSYPVIYMHDGQNLFLENTSYAGEWGVDEIMDSLIAAEVIPPTIVVGIHNSPQRAEEYVPYYDEYMVQQMQMDHWDGSLHMFFADFLTYDLFPYIEEKYSASSNKSDRALIGSSFGGIQSLWMGLNYPEYFDLIGAMSPSVWVGDGAVLREVHGIDSLPDVKAWIDIGSEEYDPRCSELVQNLHQRGWTYGKNLWYQEDLGGIHHESSWNQRIVNPILLFHGKGDAEVLASEESFFLGKSKKKGATVWHPKANLEYTLESGIRFTAMHLVDYQSDDFKVDSVGNVSMPSNQKTGVVSILWEEADFTVEVSLEN